MLKKNICEWKVAWEETQPTEPSNLVVNNLLEKDFPEKDLSHLYIVIFDIQKLLRVLHKIHLFTKSSTYQVIRLSIYHFELIFLKNKACDFRWRFIEKASVRSFCFCFS